MKSQTKKTIKSGAKNISKIVTSFLLAGSMIVSIAGCGASDSADTSNTSNASNASGGSSASSQPKEIVYGTAGYGVEMGDEGLNPHSDYSGWSCLRYGVGETLFKFSDSMEPEPWLATDYEYVDDSTVKITLRDDVTFSSGRRMDGQSVKECLEALISVHDRAPSDLKIKTIEAEGQSVTIHTTESCPSLINYLCDPYGCIIDMEYGIQDDSNVAGTGPFVAEAVSDTEISLKKNENYWGGDVKADTVKVKSIMDTDTLTMALQSGEIDAAYGLAYAGYPLFENENYQFSSCSTSRSFFAQMNTKTQALQDSNVRKAIAKGIDKDSFVSVLLNGHGEAAVGPFPKSFAFGDETVTADNYDKTEAKALLAKAGYTDSDGDGYVDKAGKKLSLKWLTYPGRAELPLLAESAQASLKEIGIDVIVNSTENASEVLQTGDWNLYAMALVTAPTGDPEYFFTTCCLDSSVKNVGGYHSDPLEDLYKKLHATSDGEKRAAIATEMEQTILDDGNYIFVSHLQMNIVSKKTVSGLEAHPCDYYEITKDLDISQ